MSRSFALSLLAVLALAAPAEAKVCSGTVQTAQPTTAKRIRAYGTTCKVARSVARHWDGTASSKDFKGRTWRYGRGTPLTRGIRNSFLRGGMKVTFVNNAG